MPETTNGERGVEFCEKSREETCRKALTRVIGKDQCRWLINDFAHTILSGGSVDKIEMGSAFALRSEQDTMERSTNLACDYLSASFTSCKQNFPPITYPPGWHKEGFETKGSARDRALI